MTMTGTMPDPTDPTRRVPWQRCAEGARLYDAWTLLIDRRLTPDPPDAAGWCDLIARCDAAWEEYHLHVLACDECEGKGEK